MDAATLTWALGAAGALLLLLIKALDAQRTKALDGAADATAALTARVAVLETKVAMCEENVAALRVRSHTAVNVEHQVGLIAAVLERVAADVAALRAR